MRSWTVWVLTSAVLLALYDLAKKASVRNNAVLPTLLISTVFGAIAFTLSLLMRGSLGLVLAIDGHTLLLAAIKSIIVATSWIFTFKALRTLPVTVATPIRASAPALVFLVALFLYHEIPTLVQGLGMLSVFAGYWVFSWAGRHEGIDFLHNRAVWCAIAGACCSAISSLWDKYVFQVAAAPVDAVQFVFQLGLILVYLVSLALECLMARSFRAAVSGFEFRWTMPLVGILLAGADWLYFSALAIPEVPISAASLVRRFSVVLTFVLGARFFHETNLPRKALALAAVVVGTAMICL